jgi:hypothetical protein
VHFWAPQANLPARTVALDHGAEGQPIAATITGATAGTRPDGTTSTTRSTRTGSTIARDSGPARRGRPSAPFPPHDAARTNCAPAVDAGTTRSYVELRWARACCGWSARVRRRGGRATSCAPRLRAALRSARRDETRPPRRACPFGCSEHMYSRTRPGVFEGRPSRSGRGDIVCGRRAARATASRWCSLIVVIDWSKSHGSAPSGPTIAAGRVRGGTSASIEPWVGLPRGPRLAWPRPGPAPTTGQGRDARPVCRRGGGRSSRLRHRAGALIPDGRALRRRGRRRGV